MNTSQGSPTFAMANVGVNTLTRTSSSFTLRESKFLIRRCEESLRVGSPWRTLANVEHGSPGRQLEPTPTTTPTGPEAARMALRAGGAL